MPVSGTFDNEHVIFYFPGMFKNPAPAVKTSCISEIIILKKNQKYYEISNLYECVEKNASKDLFGINFFTI